MSRPVSFHEACLEWLETQDDPRAAEIAADLRQEGE